MKKIFIASCIFLFFFTLLNIFNADSKILDSLAPEGKISPTGFKDQSPQWPACQKGAATQEVSFVHIADVHAHYNPDGENSSPMARVRGFYERVKKENPFTLLTNGGDDYEKGSLAEAITRGRTTREVAQAMHYDVRVLGNHDFAWGMEELLAFGRDAGGIVLGSNVEMRKIPGDPKSQQAPGWVGYAEMTVGCVRVGFFGLVSKPWNEKDEPYDGPYFHETPQLRTDFHYIETALAIITRHRQDVDLLVLVSHLGLGEDMQLAEWTEGIDLILGGHSHIALTAPRQVKDTTIVHAGAFADYIGRLDIEYDLAAKKISARRFALVPNVEREAPADRTTAMALEKILSPYRAELTGKLALIHAPKSRRDMARVAARAAVETLGVDAALVGAHTVWGEWRPGWLTQQDIFDAFKVEREPAGQPGFSSLYRMVVTGADLSKARNSLAAFAYWGPDGIVAEKLYTLAIQKPQAFHQAEHFGREISLFQPEPATELWQAVVAFARARNTVL